MPNPSQKKLAEIRVAIAAKQLELLREIPAMYQYKDARSFLSAFCAANNLPEFFPQTPEAQVALLQQLPELLGFKHLEDLIAALSTAHGRTPGRRILTPAKIEQLIELTNQGLSAQEIADILGCARQTISNVKYELGISRKQKARLVRESA